MIKDLNDKHEPCVSLAGSGTDTPPFDVPAGSTYFKINAGKTYMFDGDATWYNMADVSDTITATR